MPVGAESYDMPLGGIAIRASALKSVEHLTVELVTDEHSEIAIESPANT